jgi:hypothetical protein
MVVGGYSGLQIYYSSKFSFIPISIFYILCSTSFFMFVYSILAAIGNNTHINQISLGKTNYILITAVTLALVLGIIMFVMQIVVQMMLVEVGTADTVDLDGNSGLYMQPKPFGGNTFLSGILKNIMKNPAGWLQKQIEIGCCGWSYPGDWYSCVHANRNDWMFTEEESHPGTCLEQTQANCFPDSGAIIDSCQEWILSDLTLMFSGASGLMMFANFSMWTGNICSWIMLMKVKEPPRKVFDDGLSITRYWSRAAGKQTNLFSMLAASFLMLISLYFARDVFSAEGWEFDPGGYVSIMSLSTASIEMFLGFVGIYGASKWVRFIKRRKLGSLTRREKKAKCKKYYAVPCFLWTNNMLILVNLMTMGLCWVGYFDAVNTEKSSIGIDQNLLAQRGVFINSNWYDGIFDDMTNTTTTLQNQFVAYVGKNNGTAESIAEIGTKWKLLQSNKECCGWDSNTDYFAKGDLAGEFCEFFRNGTDSNGNVIYPNANLDARFKPCKTKLLPRVTQVSILTAGFLSVFIFFKFFSGLFYWILYRKSKVVLRERKAASVQKGLIELDTEPLLPRFSGDLVKLPRGIRRYVKLLTSEHSGILQIFATEEDDAPTSTIFLDETFSVSEVRECGLDVTSRHRGIKKIRSFDADDKSTASEWAMEIAHVLNNIRSHHRSQKLKLEQDMRSKNMSREDMLKQMGKARRENNWNRVRSKMQIISAFNRGIKRHTEFSIHLKGVSKLRSSLFDTPDPYVTFVVYPATDEHRGTSFEEKIMKGKSSHTDHVDHAHVSSPPHPGLPRKTDGKVDKSAISKARMKRHFAREFSWNNAQAVSKQARSSTKSNLTNPSWDETYNISVFSNYPMELHLRVLDWDGERNCDDHLGELCIPLDKEHAHNGKMKNYRLHDKKGKVLKTSVEFSWSMVVRRRPPSKVGGISAVVKSVSKITSGSAKTAPEVNRTELRPKSKINVTTKSVNASDKSQGKSANAEEICVEIANPLLPQSTLGGKKNTSVSPTGSDKSKVSARSRGSRRSKTSRSSRRSSSIRASRRKE